ncbi:unnamed protein product, partial [Adineta steineri]
AERLAKLGWKPHRPNMIDCIEEQVDAILNDTKNKTLIQYTYTKKNNS